ncbi:MAG: sulfatase [Clostridia bacterium]|nr:sulfatase [Clostridia bacterium]
MNVLYLNTHDIGRCLPVYGYPAQTPCLDRLSRESAVFEQCYCVSPTCSPSRGALLTGQSPHNNGLIGLAHRGFELNGRHHLAAFLSSQGYETVLSGVQHEALLRQERTLGYRRCLNDEVYYDTSLPECDRLTAQDKMAAKNAAAYLRERRPDDPPFFLAVGFGCTHRAYPRVPEDMEVDAVRVPDGLPDTPEGRRDIAALGIALGTMDACCGEVLDALRESGEYDDTLILFTTDHGLPMPGWKCCLTDGGIGVAMMLRCPGVGPRRIDALVSQLDVFPTICDALGLEKPDWLEGVTLMPLLLGETDRAREAVFAETNYHVAYQPARCARTERYKLIERGEDGYGRFPPANVDDSCFKEAYRELGYFEAPLPREELYDLAADPGERTNLAERPEYGPTLEGMRRLLHDWRAEMGDPLLFGPVPLPERAICATPDSYSTKSQVILPECRKNLEALRGSLQNVIV